MDAWAIGIAYEGEWLGSGWHVSPGGIFAAIDQSIDDSTFDPIQTAAMVRWLRLPVLLETPQATLPVFAGFARRYPAEVMAAWWRNKGLPDGLHLDSKSREVSEAVLRQLFFAWAPTDEHCERIIDVLAVESEAESRVELAKQILEKDFLYAFPQLSGHLLYRVLTTDPGYTSNRAYRDLTAWDRDMQDQLLRDQLRKDQLLKDKGISNVDDVREWLRDEASRALCRQAGKPVDEFTSRWAGNLAECTLDQVESSVDEAHTDFLIAMQNARFREFLAHQVLEQTAARLRSQES
jgi:hypothetical protein